MADREERMRQRQYAAPGEKELSAENYNLILGGALLYGFLVNCFMIKFCFEGALSLASNSIAFFLIYAIMVVVGTIMVNSQKSVALSFIGYNLIVVPLGLVLSVVVNIYAMEGYQNTITLAFALTGVVTAIMMVASTLFPDFFLSLGKTLGLTLIVTIIMELIFMLLGASLAIFDYIVVVIFCGYIGYDWVRANRCAKTFGNAVSMAAELYVDLVNLFLRLLSILARSRD